MHLSPIPRRRVGLAASMAVVLTLGAILGHAPVRTSADQLQDKQSQRGQLNLTVQQLQAEIGSVQDQQAALETIIQHLDDAIGATEARVNAAQTRLAAIDASLSDAEQQLSDARARLESDRQQLAAEMVTAYKLGSESNAVTAVFGSGDFNTGWQKVIAIHRISQSEDRTTEAVQSEKGQIEATVAQITEQKRQQRQVLAALSQEASNLQGQLVSRQNAQTLLQQVQQQDQQQLLAAEQSAREVDAEIAQLQAERAAAAAAAEAARRRAAAAEAARRQAAANHHTPGGGSSSGGGGGSSSGGGGSSSSGGGRSPFAWPESGPINQGFGCTSYIFEPYDPSCPSRHFHTGIDIGASRGTDVGAGDAGIAHLYTSSYGYGNHVIIDHGNGFVSVYGHLDAFAVSDGQTVERGQTIGYEGSTGNSTGPHLHFEIRLDENPVNPLNYLP